MRVHKAFQSLQKSRMNSRKNARLTRLGRARLMQQIAHIGLKAAAAQAGISMRRAQVWQKRWGDADMAGLCDRSSCPHVSPRMAAPDKRERIQSDPARRDDQKRHYLHACRLTPLLRSGCEGDPYHDRQWLSLPFQEIRPTAAPLGNPASAHPALHSTHQRQSRAVYSDAAAGVGLCLRLPKFRCAHARIAVLDQTLQLLPPSLRDQEPPACFAPRFNG